MDDLLTKASNIRLVVFDVDGVMTNGDIIVNSNGEELKIFYVQDGLGLQMLKKLGCQVAVISARSSEPVVKRMAELGIEHLYQGQKDKRASMLAILKDLKINKSESVYVGDDLIDLPAMNEAGIAVAVANAHPLVKSRADWVTENQGGRGAVREVCEFIIKAHGKLDQIYNEYTQK